MKAIKTQISVSQWIKVFFDESGGISNYSEKSTLIIEHFKAKLTEDLAANGIGIEWAGSFDDTCAANIKLIEIETGNRFLRFITGDIPIICFFPGPATRFEIEAHWAKGGQKFEGQYAEQHRYGNTEYSLRAASGNAASRLAEDIKRLVEALGGPSCH